METFEGYAGRVKQTARARKENRSGLYRVFEEE
jgi:hypothetical protein